MRIIAFLNILLIFFSSSSYSEVRIHCEGQETNLNTYLQIHKVLFSDRDTTRVEEFYSDKIISHNNDGGGPGSIATPEKMRKMWERSKKNNPERVLEDELILCVDDFVVVRTTIHSHDNTPLFGYPPTGKAYSITATDIYRLENGKVVERWGNSDLAHLFRQLGFKQVKE